LADEVGRQTLACIRCSACLNVCPVYERTGGHAYGSVYPGPIGAILTPQLVGTAEAGSLPFASSLCGACAEVCPVKIDIPEVLVHLRGRAVRERRSGLGERTAMAAAARTLMSPWRFRWARRVGRLVQRPYVNNGKIERLPGGLSQWTATRDLPPVPERSFRDWWKSR
jgi:L-lactate dehydrogenase complex protein LldF